VNVISSKTPDLARAGAVSAAFLDAAGDELQSVSISSLLFRSRINNNYDVKTRELKLLLFDTSLYIYIIYIYIYHILRYCTKRMLF